MTNMSLYMSFMWSCCRYDCCGNIHLKSLLVLYSVLKSYFSLKESDWLWQRVSVSCNQFSLSLSLFPTYGLFRKKSCVVKRCWIKHRPPTVYRTWQVIPNYWKLANCWNTFQATEMCFTEEQINEDAGSDCFLVDATFMFRWIHSWDLVCFTLYSLFPPPLHCSCVISHPNNALCSPYKHAHIHFHHQPLVFLSHLHTHTHKNTPPVAISATLLTGANQSHNTFIISTPRQALSCWVKSHLGLFGCFTALEICNYIMDTQGPVLAGGSHWQLDTKQTRCEVNSTPQKKKKTKTVVFLITILPSNVCAPLFSGPKLICDGVTQSENCALVCRSHISNHLWKSQMWSPLC